MRITRVRLENFKCYGEADVDIDRGVSVIHGLNGSGKSSLLEACFFALYGAVALETTLDDVVTNGEDEAEIELWFTHAGGEFHIERRIRIAGDRASTAACTLQTPNGSVDGATDVEEAVTALLRMDAEAFVNCAYVRQGEVNKLINATPRDRQAMLDELLQLGDLEEYRERAGQARLGVEDLLSERGGELSGLEGQIEEKAEKDLPDRLNALESDLAEVEAEVERFEANLETAEERLAEAQSVLDVHEAKREELEQLAADVDELREAIGECERERESLADSIGARREERSNLAETRAQLVAKTDLDDADPEAVAERIDALETEDERVRRRIEKRTLEVTRRADEVDTLRDRAAELEVEAEAKRAEAEELAADAESTEASLAERRERLGELEAELEAERARFDDAPAAFGTAADHLASLEDERESVDDRRAQLRADCQAAEEKIETAEALLAEGKCPKCGQPVDGSPHVDGVADDRERLAALTSTLDGVERERERLIERIERAERLVEAERAIDRLRETRENVRQLIDERAATLDEKRSRATELRDAATELEAEVAAKRERAGAVEEDASEHRREIAACNKRRGEVRDALDRLEELAGTLEAIADAADDVERLREKRSMLGDQNDERRRRLEDKRERKAALEDEFDEERIEWARAETERAGSYIERVEAELESLREERDRLQAAIGGVENELDELDRLRERRAALADRVEALTSLRDEADEVEALYGDLRAELRQRNIRSLERLLNETFDLVYQNDAYARIELDENYELTVYQKDGATLDPEQLSGGERALFNLSLRCAIYRLLAEGIDGAAPMPPLILDEPTVFLDAGHVSQLVTLVESMRELGVEQIVVVSHDDELVGAADDLLTVTKDATTNRSTVETAVHSLSAD